MTTRWNRGFTATLPQLLADAAAKWPDRMFVDVSGTPYSFAEIDRLARAMAGLMAERGVKQGDRVGIMLENSLDLISVMFGAMHLGAIFVPFNNALTGEFLRHQVADSEPVLVIAESEYAERLLTIADRLPDLHQLLYRGRRPAEPDHHLELLPLEVPATAGGVVPQPYIAPRDLAMLVYTSGTTGASKGCMISHNYAASYSRQINMMAELTIDDRLYVPMPLFHYNGIGMLLSALHVGSQIILAERYSVSGFWPEIKRTGATAVNLLGASIPLTAQCADSPEMADCYGQIRVVLGAPFTPEISQIFRDRFGIPHARNAAFGMTEVSLAFAGPHSSEPPVGSSGYLFPDFDARIFDEHDDECPPGVVGELVIRPNRPNIMFSGYWHRPEATLAAIRDTWFHTGDFAKVDDAGYLFFADRKKDYLRRRGENISSAEMEAVFLAHPAIAQVAVHAVPAELTEDEVKVTAMLRPGANLSEEELCRWSIERVPYFAVPRFIEFRDNLPLTPSGRVQKYLLREQGVTDATWDREQSDVTVTRQRIRA